jgi:mannose-6-phosphate isomerase-like protein (cupin superfamily)
MPVDAFEISQLIQAQQQVGQAYVEFLRVPVLSLGLYALPAGGVDPQLPHAEDEVYYVVEGRGSIRVGEEDRSVEPGTIIFVAANVEHRFHTISEDMKLLVFFAPAEYSNKPDVDS